MFKIGQIFTHNDIKLYPVEDNSCNKCHFYDGYNYECYDKSLHCKDYERSDNKSVIFQLFKFRFGR